MGWKSFRARRTDANHAEVRDGLRKIGASVYDSSTAGSGFPDLVVGFRGWTLLVEVKNPRHRKVGGEAMRKTRERQESFRLRWKGGPVVQVESLDEAIALLLRLPSATKTVEYLPFILTGQDA